MCTRTCVHTMTHLWQGSRQTVVREINTRHYTPPLHPGRGVHRRTSFPPVSRCRRVLAIYTVPQTAVGHRGFDLAILSAPRLAQTHGPGHPDHCLRCPHLCRAWPIVCKRRAASRLRARSVETRAQILTQTVKCRHADSHTQPARPGQVMLADGDAVTTQESAHTASAAPFACHCSGK